MRVKKILCAVLSLCIPAVLLASCAGSRNYSVNISGAEVTREVYAYYLDKVVSKPSDFELSVTAGENEYTEKAALLCSEYVAVNTTLKQLNLTLSSSDKAAVADTVNNLWRIYSKHYTAIGVSKQTLTKIETCKAGKDKLFLYYYDTGGAKAVREEDVKAYFTNNYIAFRVINGYLTQTDENGDTVALTEKETKELKAKFNMMAQSISKGESIEEAGKSFASEQGLSSVNTEITVINKDNSAYPVGFFDSVAKMKYGVPKVILLDEYIFLAVKENIANRDEEFYAAYREDCLKALKGSEMDREIASIAAKYSIAKNDRVIKQIYKAVSAV